MNKKKKFFKMVFCSLLKLIGYHPKKRKKLNKPMSTGNKSDNTQFIRQKKRIKWQRYFLGARNNSRHFRGGGSERADSQRKEGWGHRILKSGKIRM